jgi:hypothetical protein
MKTYAIQWKCSSTGRIGLGKSLFAKEEAERLAIELNEEYPDIDHEVVIRVFPPAEVADPEPIPPSVSEPFSQEVNCYATPQRH